MKGRWEGGRSVRKAPFSTSETTSSAGAARAGGKTDCSGRKTAGKLLSFSGKGGPLRGDRAANGETERELEIKKGRERQMVREKETRG